MVMFDPKLVHWTAVFVLALSFGILVRSAVMKTLWQGSLLERLAWQRLTQLEGELRFLRSPIPAATVMGIEIAVVLLGLSMAIFVQPLAGLLALASLLVSGVLGLERRKRVGAIEKQVEGWLGALSRALQAAPSLGEALRASAAACRAPIRDEVEFVLKEMELGKPLDRALMAWTERVNGHSLTVGVATLLVARQTGGNLPEVLRSAAASLREMERLEGVLRTKTAEGRAQAWVIGLLPLPLYFAITQVDPSFFQPLVERSWGHVIIGVALLLWVLAVLCARRILSVKL